MFLGKTQDIGIKKYRKGDCDRKNGKNNFFYHKYLFVAARLATSEMKSPNRVVMPNVEAINTRLNGQTCKDIFITLIVRSGSPAKKTLKNEFNENKITARQALAQMLANNPKNTLSAINGFLM